MRLAFEKFIDMLYPRDAVCITCGTLRVDDAHTFLCASCMAHLSRLEGPFCPRCGRSGWAMACPACMASAQDAIDARCAGYLYGDTAGQLVRALKYGRVLHAAEALADGMADVLPQRMLYDALVPIPLHRARLRVRGFNQAEALCHALQARTGIETLDAVRRTRATKTQTRLSVSQRQTNVRGAFEVCEAVDGKRLVLVDDVLTTGATALSCAEALKAAGAVHVTLCVAARADLGADG